MNTPIPNVGQWVWHESSSTLFQVASRSRKQENGASKIRLWDSPAIGDGSWFDWSECQHGNPIRLAQRAEINISMRGATLRATRDGDLLTVSDGDTSSPIAVKLPSLDASVNAAADSLAKAMSGRVASLDEE